MIADIKGNEHSRNRLKSIFFIVAWTSRDTRTVLLISHPRVAFFLFPYEDKKNIYITKTKAKFVTYEKKDDEEKYISNN